METSMAYDMEADYEWFNHHQDELADLYYGRFAVIRNKRILSTHTTELEAIEQAGLPVGEFMVQECIPESEMPGADEYVVREPGTRVAAFCAALMGMI